MLIRLMPEQVSSEWERFIIPINEILPAPYQNNHKNLTKVLAAILKEQLMVWAYYTEEGEQHVMQGMVLTTMHEDVVMDTQYLFIYGLYAKGDTTMDMIRDGMTTLTTYARANGCSGIQAYTNKKSIVEAWKSWGGDASMVLIEKGI